jgi:hypothetical protein
VWIAAFDSADDASAYVMKCLANHRSTVGELRYNVRVERPKVRVSKDKRVADSVAQPECLQMDQSPGFGLLLWRAHMQ